MHRVNRCVRFAVLAAAGLGLWASPSSGAVVALKDHATVAAGGTLDTTFSTAIGSMTVYTDTVKDTGLSSAGNSFWMNYGISTMTSGLTAPALIQFDFAQAARLRSGRGDQQGRTAGPVAVRQFRDA